MSDVKGDIEKYLRGEMSPAEMHALEKKALYNPFLADALEGGSSLHPDDLKRDIEGLNKQLLNRSIRTRKKAPWLFRAAAVVLLLAVSSFLIFLLTSKDEQVTPITYNSTKPAAPTTDSIRTSGDQPQVGAGQQKETATEPAKKENVEEAEPGPNEAVSDQLSTSRKNKDEEERVAKKALPSTSIVEDDDRPSPALPERADSQLAPPITELRSNRAAKEEEPAARSRGAAARGFTSMLTVKGEVTDVDDGLPLPGVNVGVAGTSIGTVTDLNGNYELTVPEDATALTFSFVGLQSREVPLPRKNEVQAELNVEMEPDVTQLSEVVVSGFGTESKPELEETRWELAEPIGGKREFKKYLENNMRYPETAIQNKVEGKVTIQFTIEPSGTLSDFRVAKGIGFGCDEEVVRLIKEGPGWKPTKKNDEPVRGKGKVKLRFALPKGK